MKRAFGATLFAAVTLLAGCGLTPKHTITAAHAVRVMDGYLQETIRSVPSSLRFSQRAADTEYTGGCTKYPVGDFFTGQVQPSLTYTAKTTHPEEAISFLNGTASHWRARNASVESQPDGYRIQPNNSDYKLAVFYYAEAHLVELLGVLDACIWPNGTPGPHDNP
ncbi:MAG TPA: hypothetical protein VFU43_05150 [Streptosporangiaceae bacterium]|nr:hypothetical protein [Streptosporangiaceae bacterium]